MLSENDQRSFYGGDPLPTSPNGTRRFSRSGSQGTRADGL